MNQLDKRYWLLIPAGILTGVMSVLSVYFLEANNDDYPAFILITMIICGGLPFVSVGFILHKIHPGKKSLLSVGGIGIVVAMFAVAAGTFTFILTVWLDIFVISASIGSAAAMMTMRNYIVNRYSVTNDRLAKITTFFAGMIGGAVSLAFYGEWIPRRIMGDFPLNLMVGYTVFILFFNSTFLLSELKKNRKMITFWFFLIFASLLFDIFSRGLLLNLSDVTSKWI